MLDAVKDEIKEEREEDNADRDGGKRMSRRQDVHPVDQTNGTMNPTNMSYSQPHVSVQFQNMPQGQQPPTMVIYTQGPPVTQPPPNIILSNVQPPPL